MLSTLRVRFSNNMGLQMKRAWHYWCTNLIMRLLDPRAHLVWYSATHVGNACYLYSRTGMLA